MEAEWPEFILAGCDELLYGQAELEEEGFVFVMQKAFHVYFIVKLFGDVACMEQVAVQLAFRSHLLDSLAPRGGRYRKRPITIRDDDVIQISNRIPHQAQRHPSGRIQKA